MKKNRGSADLMTILIVLAIIVLVLLLLGKL